MSRERGGNTRSLFDGRKLTAGQLVRDDAQPICPSFKLQVLTWILPRWLIRALSVGPTGVIIENWTLPTPKTGALVFGNWGSDD